MDGREGVIRRQVREGGSSDAVDGGAGGGDGGAQETSAGGLCSPGTFHMAVVLQQMKQVLLLLLPLWPLSRSFSPSLLLYMAIFFSLVIAAHFRQRNSDCSTFSSFLHRALIIFASLNIHYLWKNFLHSSQSFFR